MTVKPDLKIVPSLEMKFIAATSLLAFIVLMTLLAFTLNARAGSAAIPTTPTINSSPDYIKGWCAGYNASVTSVRESRDRWRGYAGLPSETIKQVLRRIYSKPRSGGFAPRTLDPPSGTPEPVAMSDSIDLYLVPMHINGNITILGKKSMRVIVCNGPDDSGDLP